MENVEKWLSEVDREIAACQQHFGGNWRIHALNNWGFNLPGGFCRDINADVLDELSESQSIYPDTGKEGYFIGEGEERIIPGKTEKRLSQTHREFYKTIDDALERRAISFDWVRSLQGTDADKRNELYAITLPAYRDLRAQGYSWQDLCG